MSTAEKTPTNRQEYDYNLAWFKDHYRVLKEKHKGKLCLVINGEGKVFDNVSDLLERLKGSDMTSAVIQYIT
jgi:hypothetical protein